MAQASEKVSLVGIPASPKAHFTLLPDRQKSLWHAEGTARRCHLRSPLSSGSINSHVTRDPLNVCLLTESRTGRDIPTITAGPRFFQHPSHARHQHALRLACPKATGQGYYVPDSRSNGRLRCTLYAGGSAVPCRQLGNLHPDHMPLTQGSSLTTS